MAWGLRKTFAAIKTASKRGLNGPGPTPESKSKPSPGPPQPLSLVYIKPKHRLIRPRPALRSAATRCLAHAFSVSALTARGFSAGHSKYSNTLSYHAVKRARKKLCSIYWTKSLAIHTFNNALLLASPERILKKRNTLNVLWTSVGYEIKSEQNNTFFKMYRAVTFWSASRGWNETGESFPLLLIHCLIAKIRMERSCGDVTPVPGLPHQQLISDQHSLWVQYLLHDGCPSKQTQPVRLYPQD